MKNNLVYKIITMKITSTTTSTSLFDLIEAQNSTALDLIENKRINRDRSGNYGVEIAYVWDDIYVETILDEATTDSRPVSSDLPIFAFNCKDIHNVYVYGAWDFSLSIV